VTTHPLVSFQAVEYLQNMQPKTPLRGRLAILAQMGASACHASMEEDIDCGWEEWERWFSEEGK